MHAQTPKAFSTRMLTCLADTFKQSVSNLEISLTYAHKAGQTTLDRSRDLSNELAVLKSSFIPTMMSHKVVLCMMLTEREGSLCSLLRWDGSAELSTVSVL